MGSSVHAELQYEGYEISGDVRSGLKATVPFLVAWKDAIQFANDMVASPKATRVGTIIWKIPDQFIVPFGGNNPRMYAQAFKIKPCGVLQNQTTGEWYPNYGLFPGEYYTHAVVTLQYESVPMQFQPGDDQNGLNQLDPSNPITMCEQSVDINGKVVTRDGANYKYVTSGNIVTDDVQIVMNEAKLVLSFPQVPYLPWQLVQPYVGKINKTPVLACARGALLLEGMGTKYTPKPDGDFGQNVTLKFAWNPDPTGTTTQGMDWNAFPIRGTGAFDIIVDGSGKNPYSYAEFANIFLGLQFA
jgi:hypothetical protein